MSTAIVYENVAAPVREAGFVGYVATDGLDDRPCELLAGTRWRLLSGDRSSGQLAAVIDLPAGYARSAGRLGIAGSLDLVVLDGLFDFGAERLGPRDFAFVPAGLALPDLHSSEGTRILMFVDPPPDSDARIAAQAALGAFVTRYDDHGWQEASLVRSAGLELDLAVQMLKTDPATTARTWYVRQGAGGKVPWERHSVVEEGYLIAGEYRLAERLPDRTVIGDYAPGGYFRRPSGVLHSGPASGTETGAIWLQRSPAALDVTFVTD
jgi:hypothetical protein